MGEPPPPAPLLRFDTFAHALRAAEAGAGVLLASLAICEEAVRAGRLVHLTETSIQMEGSYWATWPRIGGAFAERTKLVDCLCETDADRNARISRT
jgi:LysR family glycine cleavage system transcriptional activator